MIEIVTTDSFVYFLNIKGALAHYRDGATDFVDAKEAACVVRLN